MQALSKAALLALGLSISGTAMADEYFGGPPLYNPQYAYNSVQYSYGYPTYTDYYGGYPYYPAYNSYGYPAYGGYSGAPYSWPYAYWNPAAPHSRVNPNWVPYAGWR